MSGRTPKNGRTQTYTAKAVMVDAPQLAARLTRQMELKGVGTRDLAKATKVDKATISAWRSGTQTRVKVPTVRKVAARLDTTAEYLLDMPLMKQPSHAQPTPEQLDLVRRVTSLGPKLAGMEEVLPELGDLVKAAKRAKGGKAAQRSSPRRR